MNNDAFINASPYAPKTFKETSNTEVPSQSKSYQTPTDSILPFAVSAGASVLGDVAGMINYNKNMPRSISFPRMAPVNISLEPQRQGLQREYNTNRNIAIRNSRDMSSPANAYANSIAGVGALTDSFGDRMNQSYMQEANMNKESGLRVNEKNTELGMQERLRNLQLKEQRTGVMGNYINSLSSVLPEALKDYRQQVNQTDMYNIMGKDYGLFEKYNPNMSFADKLRRGLIGSHVSVLNKDNPNIIGQ
jgi:uncharacterized protein with von Willebrand factor type A (vWA) domain